MQTFGRWFSTSPGPLGAQDGALDARDNSQRSRRRTGRGASLAISTTVYMYSYM